MGERLRHRLRRVCHERCACGRSRKERTPVNVALVLTGHGVSSNCACLDGKGSSVNSTLSMEAPAPRGASATLQMDHRIPTVTMPEPRTPRNDAVRTTGLRLVTDPCRAPWLGPVGRLRVAGLTGSRGRAALPRTRQDTSWLRDSETLR